jgi:hypothetical protein
MDMIVIIIFVFQATLDCRFIAFFKKDLAWWQQNTLGANLLYSYVPFIIIFPFSRFNEDRNEDLGMDLSQEKSN